MDTENKDLDKVMIPTDKVRLNIWIKKTVWDSIDDVAREEDMSFSDVVRAALKEYIRKYKGRIKKEF